MLRGWLAGGLDPKTVTVIDPAGPSLPEGVRLLTAPPPDGEEPATLVLAVKPQLLDAAAPALAALLAPETLVLSILAVLCLYAFARRLSGVRSVATLAVVLFLFGAGLGWIATVARIDTSHDLLGTLANAPWDTTAQADLHIRFFNPYLAFLMSQRAYLYGLPIAMLVVTLLVRAARRRATRTFVLAGVVAGLLPLAHLPTLLALAMVTPFLVLLLARRPWHLGGARRPRSCGS